jgi:hypothetical protein
MRIALVVAVVLAVSAAPAQAGWYKPTHRVSVSGEFVNRWTMDEPGECGAVGGGTVTVDFKSRTPNRAMVGIFRTHASETNDGKGSWALLVIADSAGHISDMEAKPARGTITRSDETQPRPGPFVDADSDGIDDNEPCPAPDRTGCGATRLSKASVYVGGYDSKRIRVDLPAPRWMEMPCHQGSLDLFSSPPSLAGGNARGELLLRMPRASKLRRRKVVTVRGSSHKRTRSGDPGSTAHTDDVTRRVAVTFTRL